MSEVPLYAYEGEYACTEASRFFCPIDDMSSSRVIAIMNTGVCVCVCG